MKEDTDSKGFPELAQSWDSVSRFHRGTPLLSRTWEKREPQAQFRLCRTWACSGHGARPCQPGYHFSVSSGLCFPCPGGDGEEGHTCSWVGPPSPWQHVARAESRGLSCRGQSLRLGGGLGTWSWQVRLGTLGVREVGRLEQGKVRHSRKEKGSVCSVPTGRVGSPTGAAGNSHPCTSPALALAGAPCCPPGFQNLLCHPLTQKRPWT